METMRALIQINAMIVVSIRGHVTSSPIVAKRFFSQA